MRVAACLGVGAAGGLRAEEIVLRRGCGYSIVIAERPDPVVRFAAGEDVFLQSYDSVVLSVGLVPDTDDDTILQLAVPRDPWGDLKDDHCSERGIFLAGSCRGPKDIGHCVSDGILAAVKVMKHLEADHE